MPESTVASLLERIRVAALKQTVECSALMGDIIDSSIGGSVRCSICGAVSATAPYLYTLKHSRILNPAFVPLLALVQEKCPSPGVSISGGKQLAKPIHLRSCWCGSTIHVLRTAFIESLNIGMVEGGLIAALGEAPNSFGASLLVHRLVDLLLEPGDYRIEALTAVAEWLEALKRRRNEHSEMHVINSDRRLSGRRNGIPLPTVA